MCVCVRVLARLFLNGALHSSDHLGRPVLTFLSRCLHMYEYK